MNTTYYRDLLAGNIFQTQTSPAIPSIYYIGLSKTAPDVSGGNVSEPDYSAGYTRVALSDLSIPAEGVVTNTADIIFPQTTADVGVVTHYVVYDAASDGNLLFYNSLTKSRTLESESVLIIKAGELTLSVENK